MSAAPRAKGWAASLIRISNHEVETLQKRLAEVAGRREQAELKLTMLDAEAEAEARMADELAQASVYHVGFHAGLRLRRTAALAALAEVQAEELGARDALTSAFESLKKYEHVAELARLAAAREGARLEAAQLDELALRRAAG